MYQPDLLACWQGGQESHNLPSEDFLGGARALAGCQNCAKTEIVQKPNGKMTKHVVQIVHFGTY